MPASGTGVLAQGIRADSLRGTRIRVAAWLRARDVHEVRFFARVDGPGSVLDFGNASGDPLTGTVDWTLREIVLDVPSDAIGVTFGIDAMSASRPAVRSCGTAGPAPAPTVGGLRGRGNGNNTSY